MRFPQQVDETFRITETFGAMRRSKHTPEVDTNCTIVGWGYTVDVNKVKKLLISMEPFDITMGFSVFFFRAHFDFDDFDVLVMCAFNIFYLPKFYPKTNQNPL